MGLFKKQSKSTLHQPSPPEIDVATIPPIPAPTQLQKRERSPSPSPPPSSSSSPSSSSQKQQRPKKRLNKQTSQQLVVHYPPRWAPPSDANGTQSSPKPQQMQTFLPIPKPWNGSMLTIYDFANAMRGYFRRVPQHLFQAMDILAKSIPESYHFIIKGVPRDDINTAKRFLGILNPKENRPFILTDALIAYFIQQTDPPAQSIVQLAHTHNFMTTECVNLRAVESFNIFHRNLANKAGASEDIRKYAYIQALDKHEFKDIRLDIDPALSYDAIQSFVLKRANEILQKRFKDHRHRPTVVAPLPPRHSEMPRIACA